MPTVGFLGTGAMAAAIIGGVAQRTKLFDTFALCDLNADAVAHCCTLVGDRAQSTRVADISALFQVSDVVFLAIKPQVAVKLLPTLRNVVSKKHLVISIMAGITLDTLRTAIGPEPRLIRTMPNAPLLVGQGTTAVALDRSATPQDAALARDIFSSIGFCAEVPEGLLDAVTGVSGSGPSYLALVIEALADGGVKKGIPRPLAIQLAASTVAGAGLLVLKGGPKGSVLHPALMKDTVCSPFGTSIHGVAAAEAAGLRPAILAAVCAAAERAEELGRPKAKL